MVILELYNLKKDIGEKNNLINQYPTIVNRLLEKMIAFRQKIKKKARPAVE